MILGAPIERCRLLLLGLIILAVMCCVFVAALPSGADEVEDLLQPSVSRGFEFDYNGRYVWRGLPCSDGPVLQQSFWLTVNDLTFGVWANRDLEAAGCHQTNELDYYVSWETEWLGASLENTVQLYTYPNVPDAESTLTADVVASWEIGDFSLFTTQSVDLAEYAGAYYGDVGLSYAMDIGHETAMESSISIGWASRAFNEAYFGCPKAALNAVAIRVSATRPLTDRSYVRAHFDYSSLLDHELRDSVSDASIASLGIAFGTEF